MVSRIFKKSFLCLCIGGLAVTMLFGLNGCGSGKKLSYEETVKTALEKKYNREFMVETLTKKDAGTFLTDEYSGFAYEADAPLRRFKVWISDNKKNITDTYYCVDVISSAGEWVQDEATKVWNPVRATVVFDALRCNPNARYNPDEYMRFLEEELVESIVYLFINEKDVSADQYMQFDSSINKKMTGYVLIFCLSDDLEAIDMSKYLHAEPDYSIRIGASRTVIDKKFRQGGE